MCRNWLYDSGVLKSRTFSLPVICVGNLSVGGTGKTPMIEYLLHFLVPHYRVATLSRGYGRRTSGFKLLSREDQAEAVGDEPLQFKNKFPQAIVAVDEKRHRGIDTLISEKAPEVVLLDDAFQHRQVKAGLNILLTVHKNLYNADVILPSGNLREPAVGARRADIIVVTKCPESLSLEERHSIRGKLKLRSYQHLFFSYIGYGDHLISKDKSVDVASLKGIRFTLVTGIADTAPLLQFLNRIHSDFKHLKFPDHHNFKEEDLKKISAADFIVTTEKDYMRLKDSLVHRHLFYVPIQTRFLQNSGEFDKLISDFINKK